jgi:SAM-dependent methyltransferase
MRGKWRTGPVAAGSPPVAPPARNSPVIWHEVECGSYAADLALWEELAKVAAGPILELGCGSGRVVSHLASRGHEPRGLDSDARLIADLGCAQQGDAQDFDLGCEFALILAPMQLVQLFADAEERLNCLRCVAAHLAIGGLAAFAIVEEMPEPIEAGPPLPDTREVDGWVYSSLPVDAQVADGEIRMRRLRQTVSPTGELGDELHELKLQALSAATLEDEAHRVGLATVGRRAVPPTADHVGSTVLLLEREA